MPGFNYRPAKLLLAIVSRHSGDYFVKFTKEVGARGGTIAFSRSLTGGKLLNLLALADVHQEIIFMVLGAEADKVIEAVKKEAADHPRRIRGLAVVLEVPAMGLRVMNPVAPGTSGNDVESSGRETGETNAKRETMSSNFKLITVIVNSGHANEIMAEARQAGAKGGTIMTARGTGTEDDVKFFGISLVPEKEILMIISDLETFDSILASINQSPALAEPGSGIVYVQNVEEFITLGK
ncbi:MAG: P-II family nitrogen regulator [Deltaproteobacteria bacterium]|jgi:nitrogen regulatory protein PII|nr:P-II family nitrogen regulator [Deltaproteobacteria bacterium]